MLSRCLDMDGTQQRTTGSATAVSDASTVCLCAACLSSIVSVFTQKHILLWCRAFDDLLCGSCVLTGAY